MAARSSAGGSGRALPQRNRAVPSPGTLDDTSRRNSDTTQTTGTTWCGRRPGGACRSRRSGAWSGLQVGRRAVSDGACRDTAGQAACVRAPGVAGHEQRPRRPCTGRGGDPGAVRTQWDHQPPFPLGREQRPGGRRPRVSRGCRVPQLEGTVRRRIDLAPHGRRGGPDSGVPGLSAPAGPGRHCTL